MILLDTNIVTEFMTSPRVDAVFNWLNVHKLHSLYVSTITIAEIGYGLEIMPGDKRQSLLVERFITRLLSSECYLSTQMQPANIRK